MKKFTSFYQPELLRQYKYFSVSSTAMLDCSVVPNSNFTRHILNTGTRYLVEDYIVSDITSVELIAADYYVSFEFTNQ